MKTRVVAVFFLLGHPLLFGMGFCLVDMVTAERTTSLSSLCAETLAATVCLWFLVRSLAALSAYSPAVREPNSRWLVLGVATLCFMLMAITLANADTAGLFSKGGRLDFYFANDWFRRIVTFSYVPMAAATYYALDVLLTPWQKHKRALAICYLLALFGWSLFAGSKGAAVLMVASVAPLVFTHKKMPVAKVSIAVSLAVVLYLALFLSLTSDASINLLGILMRFYLSIDMSILLQGQAGTSELLAGRLGDVWTELFRSLGSLGVRVADEPIGVMVSQYVLGTAPTVGSNLRYGSMLLLYPDRLDFLLLYPALVALGAFVLEDILKRVGLPRGALAAVPFFVFQSFQDAYWLATHAVPMVLVFVSMQLGRAISRESLRRTSNAA